MAVLVLRHLAEQFDVVDASAGEDVVDAVDGEGDAVQTRRVGRRVPLSAAFESPGPTTGAAIDQRGDTLWGAGWVRRFIEQVWDHSRAWGGRFQRAPSMGYPRP